MPSLAVKYRPKKWEDVMEQSVVTKMLKDICESDELGCRNFLLIGPAGTGKAQPLGSKVLTPEGFIEMRDVKIGTTVFTAKGNIGKVSGIYPQGIRPIYRIHADDGSWIDVSDQHLNSVSLLNEETMSYEETVITTEQLIKYMEEHSAPVHIDIPSVDWEPSDPYALDFRYVGSCVGASKFFEHVPDSIKFSPRQCRIDFLKGLASYSLPAESGELNLVIENSLSDDVSFIVKSLGLKESKVCSGEFFIHHIKVSAWNLLQNGILSCSPESQTRSISMIESIGKDECQCIMIDHPDHTYISDNFMPTHNTTSARIMASVLNEGKGEPIELDAASNNGVENMRDLMQQAKAFPMGTKYKIFILDEVHALSSASWQAMLATLESGPAKSVFIMCTTNPEKIPATILSRVQTFQLSKISLEGISSRLKYILDSETAEGNNLKYTDDAVNFIAKISGGGMRDAITNLEQCLAYSKDVSIENVVKALNLPNYDDYFALLSAVASKNNTEITNIVNRVYNSGVNFVKWFQAFQSFIMNIVKYIFLQDINQTVIPSYYSDKISKYGAPHANLCLKLSSKLMQLNKDLPTTQYQQELALTCLLSPVQKSGGSQ